MGAATDIASVVVAGVGSAAVVAALVYASRQTNVLQGQLTLQSVQAEQLLRAQRAGNDLMLMQQVLDLDRLFVDSPELRPYFYSGTEVPPDGFEQERVFATAELIVDIADCVATMIRSEQLDPDDQAAWRAALEVYGRSPAIRAVIADDVEGVWRPATVALLQVDKPFAPPAPASDARDDATV